MHSGITVCNFHQRMRTLLAILCIVLSCLHTQAQEKEPLQVAKTVGSIDEKILSSLNKKYAATEARLTKQTSKWLRKMQRQEARLKKQLAKTDNAKAEQVFGNVEERYKLMQQQLQKKGGKVRQYYPALDSLNTAARFLQQPSGITLPKLPNTPSLPNTGIPQNTASLLPQTNVASQLSGTVQTLQQRMQNATDIKRQIQQRKEQLKSQLKNTVVANKLNGYKKQAYYYQQQLEEYKNALGNTDKLTEKALGFVRENSAFKSFFNQNSQLASLFKIPDNAGSGGTASIAGLQTRASVMQSLQQKLGIDINAANNANPQAMLKDKLDAAKGELDKLKNKLNSSGGQVRDDDMPNFKPNSQRTKPFLQRLEYGINIQSQKSNTLLPTTSDIAATIGYKFNDYTTAGIGLSYKLGWGNGWEHIQLTNQGIGYRTYGEIKFPQTGKERSLWNFFTKSLWLSGGYELNYLPELKEKLTNANSLSFANKASSRFGLGWQESALIGISKKQKMGKKTASVQLLYDLLYKQHPAQSSPIVFRIAYTLK